MCNPLPPTPLLRPHLTMCLAPCPADTVIFSTMNVILLFSCKGDPRRSAGNEKVLNFWEGLEDELWCVRTRAASASGWSCVLACTLHHA
jgi:hypothetical protein